MSKQELPGESGGKKSFNLRRIKIKVVIMSIAFIVVLVSVVFGFIITLISYLNTIKDGFMSNSAAQHAISGLAVTANARNCKWIYWNYWFWKFNFNYS